jgi:hypothetical protein
LTVPYHPVKPYGKQVVNVWPKSILVSEGTFVQI